MGEPSKWDCFKIWLSSLVPCSIFGHQYKYKPLEGDKPPFEFDYCTRCYANNPSQVNR